jgi:DNA polymerase-1
VSERSFIYKPGRGGEEADILGVPEILDQWEIERIEQVIDVLGLMGDSSDNVPGVPGIGPKTAKKLIARYGSVENLLEHSHELKGKQQQNVEEYKPQALLSKELVTIECDVPLETGLDDLQRVEWDREKLEALFIELEFNTFGKRLLGDEFGAEQEVQSGPLQKLADVDHDYHLVATPEKRQALIEALLQQSSFCFDSETTGLDARTCDIIGLAFSWAPHTGYYVPLPHDRDEVLAILEEFRPVFASESEKIGHNLKYDLSVLRWHGIRVAGPFFDTMLAATLAEPELRRSMDELSRSLLSYEPVAISALIGDKGEEQLTLLAVPVEQVAEYATEDADITLQLAALLRPKIEEMGQSQLFYEIECPLLPVLVDMEHEGIRLEVQALDALSLQFRDSIEQAAERVFELAGERFNLNSGSQLGNILFEKMELDSNARRTQKTGQYQTGEQVLRRLAYRHEIAREVLDYRLHTKLKSTYVDMLPGSVNTSTGRIHTHYEQLMTATGRMKSDRPNLQNIPIRSEQGREIRRAFVPRNEEYLLFSADYSQIELRIAAELSGDESMLETFKSSGDIHAATAMKIYRVREDQVTGDMRRQAKTVNFGIIYGISPFGLAERLDVTRKQAAEMIEQYFDQYPGVRNYFEETLEFARDKGYVETVTGRRRYLRDINSRNATTRKGAERNAINTRIQGTAADMIKIAMSRIHRLIRERAFRSTMLLQVHDELVFDLHRDEVETLPPLVVKEMREAMPMRVPIEVEMGTGETWLEAH